MIEAVVFDMDGVLIDSEQVWDDIRENLARERGGRWSDRAQRDMMGMSSPEWSRYMHEVVGLPESPDEINREVVERLLERYAGDPPWLPGAVETLRRLAVDPARCAAVEDSHNGIRSAKAAGMRCVAVPNAHYPPGEAVAEADAVVAGLGDLTLDVLRGTSTAS